MQCELFNSVQLKYYMFIILTGLAKPRENLRVNVGTVINRVQ